MVIELADDRENEGENVSRSVVVFTYTIRKIRLDEEIDLAAPRHRVYIMQTPMHGNYG